MHIYQVSEFVFNASSAPCWCRIEKKLANGAEQRIWNCIFVHPCMCLCVYKRMSIIFTFRQDYIPPEGLRSHKQAVGTMQWLKEWSPADVCDKQRDILDKEWLNCLLSNTVLFYLWIFWGVYLHYLVHNSSKVKRQWVDKCKPLPCWFGASFVLLQ